MATTYHLTKQYGSLSISPMDSLGSSVAIDTDSESYSSRPETAESGLITRVKSSPKSFRAGQFADRETLSWHFPKIKHEKNFRIWVSRRSQALVLQIALIFAVFVANVSLTAYVYSKYSSENGVGLIYNGDCSFVNKLDQWVHLLINILSTGMLSASNYYMQLQAAPTRADVDRAHKVGKWLDIGVPSIKNLAYISGWRRFSWFVLALSSIPIHLM
jgi:hypothetical protein